MFRWPKRNPPFGRNATFVECSFHVGYKTGIQVIEFPSGAFVLDTSIGTFFLVVKTWWWSRWSESHLNIHQVTLLFLFFFFFKVNFCSHWHEPGTSHKPYYLSQASRTTSIGYLIFLDQKRKRLSTSILSIGSHVYSYNYAWNF